VPLLPSRTKIGASSEINEVEKLAALAAHGEGEQREDAFTRLYEVLYAVVVRDIRWRVADLQTAEDLAQEVWIKVARSISSYEGRGGGFLGWLLTIARNTVRDHYNSKKRRVQESLSPDMWVVSLMPSGEVGPTEAAERRDLAERVAAFVERLPQTYRDVLRLRIFDGLTCEETARVMGKTPGAVKVAQHRALSRLSALMPERDETLAEYVYAARTDIREHEPVGAAQG
jgi:RNA polymerase sigma-70 factor (ECF subfamily)